MCEICHIHNPCKPAALLLYPHVHSFALYWHCRRWFKAWRDDLDARGEEARSSREGRKADDRYHLQLSYFKPLFQHLERRDLNEEIKVGLWEIVEAARNRNYQQANQLYLNLSIGTAPWPIGVTSVGIHERSAREKISFSWNGEAHIMNDEATRKYLQALQQLLRHVQRLFPTDPSRSMDFSTTGHAGVGAFGAGSEKQVRRGVCLLLTRSCFSATRHVGTSGVCPASRTAVHLLQIMLSRCY